MEFCSGVTTAVVRRRHEAAQAISINRREPHFTP
jgi:hypothetical protein